MHPTANLKLLRFGSNDTAEMLVNTAMDTHCDTYVDIVKHTTDEHSMSVDSQCCDRIAHRRDPLSEKSDSFTYVSAVEAQEPQCSDSIAKHSGDATSANADRIGCH